MAQHYQLHVLSSAPPAQENDQIMTMLAGQPRQLPFHLFYDDAGSALFQQITQTPEYYLTRTEHWILNQYRHEIVAACANRVWLEPGAGSCEKAELLLTDSNAAAYVAIDIATEPLRQAAERLHQRQPTMPVHLLVGDFRHDMPLLQALLPAGKRTVFYPGSSIGNFSPDTAVGWLTDLAALAGDQGQLLIGFDLPKASAVLNAAYNDTAGITAAFHLNMLQHLHNRGFQLNCPDFAHVAFYNDAEHRIEMHLQARRHTAIQWQDRKIEVTEGERILTEYSYKYPLAMFVELAQRAGWRYQQHWQDNQAWFAVALFARA